MSDDRWANRILRARHLATTHPAAAEILTFYAALAEYQSSLLEVVSPPAPRSNSFVEALDLGPVVTAIPDFLSWLQRNASAHLAEKAAEMDTINEGGWHQFVISYLEDSRHGVLDSNGTLAFVVEAVIQPFAEQLAIQLPSMSSELTAMANCHICGGRPVAGVLREESHGAKRTLLCGLCLTERTYLRVVCPACGEQQFDELPIYTAEQFPYVRIEACESCRTYLKTIDLTKDGRAVPLVDDIASVSLDLWAREQGYVRLRPNLLRL